MSEASTPAILPGETLADAAGRRIGTIDAVFADYLLVRTSALVPVDLYIPIAETAVGEGEARRVQTTRAEAIERWHRPLKQAPHAD